MQLPSRPVTRPTAEKPTAGSLPAAGRSAADGIPAETAGAVPRSRLVGAWIVSREPAVLPVVPSTADGAAVRSATIGAAAERPQFTLFAALRFAAGTVTMLA